ncbi:MAG: hypothetical protein ABIH64_02175 [Nanoarchaeota archaeon]
MGWMQKLIQKRRKRKLLTALLIAGAGIGIGHRIWSKRLPPSDIIPKAAEANISDEQKAELKGAEAKLKGIKREAEQKAAEETEQTARELTTALNRTPDANLWFARHMNDMEHIRFLIKQEQTDNATKEAEKLIATAKKECPEAEKLIQAKITELQGEQKRLKKAETTRTKSAFKGFLKYQQETIKKEGITLEDYNKSGGDKQIESAVAQMRGKGSIPKMIGATIFYYKEGKPKSFYLVLTFKPDRTEGESPDIFSGTDIIRLVDMRNPNKTIRDLQQRAIALLQ